MRMNIINYLACPECQTKLSFSIQRKIKERIVKGELKCKRCGKKFYIKNGIAYFASCIKKQFERNPQKLRRITIKQEIPKTWMKFYSKKELVALYKEWNWMLSVIKKNINTIHLDFATGTGRFLRNVVSKTKGEVITLDNGYGTCQELQYFLKKIGKYNRVSIICADARKMPFRSGVFNSVSSWHGLDEPRIKDAIKEAKRVLKRGGFFVASGFHYQKGSKSFLRAKKHGINFLIKEEIIHTLMDVSFHKIKHKVFYKGRWNGKGDYLPMYNDLYITYAIRGKK